MNCWTFLLLKTLLVLPVFSQESLKFVGNFTNFQHNIRGSLYSRGSQELVIRGFSYDGQGPSGDHSVFFYVLNSSYPYSPEDVTRGYKNSQGFKLLLPFPSDGEIYQYEDDLPDLRVHFNHLMEQQGVARHSGKTILFEGVYKLFLLLI